MKSFYLLLGVVVGFLLPNIIARACTQHEDVHAKYLQYEAKERKHQKTFDSILLIHNKWVAAEQRLTGSGKVFNADGSKTAEYLKILKEKKHALALLDTLAKAVW